MKEKAFYVSPARFLKEAGISRRALKAMEQAGTIHPVVLPGCTYARYRRSDLEKITRGAKKRLRADIRLDQEMDNMLRQAALACKLPVSVIVKRILYEHLEKFVEKWMLPTESSTETGV
jgi:hypothetical protein